MVELPVGPHRVGLLPMGQEPARTQQVKVERDEIVMLRVQIEGE
jgi:hypothetical protein